MDKLGGRDFEAGRGPNWRDSLDESGHPTHAPERATSGCHHCGGSLDAKAAAGQYECPWCVARYPRDTVQAVVTSARNFIELLDEIGPGPYRPSELTRCVASRCALEEALDDVQQERLER